MDRGVWAASQCERVAELAGHHLGALELESDGGLVDEHVQQAGHAALILTLFEHKRLI